VPWVRPPTITWANTSTSTATVTVRTASNSTTTGIYTVDAGSTWYFEPNPPLHPGDHLVLTYGEPDPRENWGWESRQVGNDDITWEDAEQVRALYTERRQARTAAVDRAAATLLGLLNEAQRASYEADRTFLVVGSEGGLYRIRPGSMGNVDWFDPTEVEPRRPAGQLCAHPVLHDGEGHLPDPDVALAQLLHLTTDEPGWLRRANVHAGRAPRHPVAA